MPGETRTRPEALAEWVRRVRRSWGMTQVELADMLHIHPQTVSKLERGHEPGRWFGRRLRERLAVLDPDALQGHAAEQHYTEKDGK